MPSSDHNRPEESGLQSSPTSKKRVLDTIHHKAPDRVPLDYWARTDVTNQLMSFLNVDSLEKLYERLGIDIRRIPIQEHHPNFENHITGTLGGSSESSGRKYIIYEDGRFEDAWGIVRRLGSTGEYDEWISGPFVETMDLNSFSWPQGDIYDSAATIHHRVMACQGQFALFGRINLPFKIAWHMRGLENFLCDMLTDPVFARELLQRIADYEREKGIRLIQAGVDIVGIYGDLAMQDRMLVEPEAWRRLEKPLLASMVEDFRRVNPDILMFFHSDGNITEILPDLIEIGFNIINPIQPECMDPEAIKREYGGKFTLHGTISIQRTLPYGTTDDVEEEVRHRIKTCGYDGGLIICPSNMIQKDTPLENIVALYDAVLKTNSGVERKHNARS